MKETYYSRNRERILARLNAKYREDAAFRGKARRKYRQRYREDPEYRKATLERANRRYQDQKKKG